MKSLSEPAIPVLTRRQVLVNYFSQGSHVPRMNPNDVLTIDIHLGGVFSSDKLKLKYTLDEVMHVLAEMKLRDIPFVTYEQAEEIQLQQAKAHIAAQRIQYAAMERIDKEITKLTGVGDLDKALRDDKVDVASFNLGQYIASKFFKKT